PGDRLPARGAAAVIARVVRNHSPGSFRLFLYADPGVAGEIGVDGWADDGHGRSRGLVVRETAPGALEADPCRDSEFVAGGTCRAVRLQDGSALFVRRGAGPTHKTRMGGRRRPGGHRGLRRVRQRLVPAAPDSPSAVRGRDRHPGAPDLQDHAARGDRPCGRRRAEPSGPVASAGGWFSTSSVPWPSASGSGTAATPAWRVPALFAADRVSAPSVKHTRL